MVFPYTVEPYMAGPYTAEPYMAGPCMAELSGVIKYLLPCVKAQGGS